jgi:MoaA/NifB/PqqE/SkfB family radical SAM enzyme
MWSQRLDELTRGTIRPSMIANFSVTSMCTFRCASCNIGRNYMADPGLAAGDLTVDEVAAILDRDADTLKHVSWIQITGGEPFLRRDIAELLGAFQRRLPHCGFWIPTNGWQPGPIAERVREILEKCERLGVGVSLHGTRERHDAFSGPAGSYDRALETLDRLKAVQADHPRLRLSIGYTITRDNVDDLGRVFDLARERGAEFTCRVALPSSLYYQIDDTGTSGEEFASILEPKIADLERKMGFHGLLVSPLQYLRWRYYRGLVRHVRQPRRRQLKCRAGKTSLYVTAKGNVHPCLFMPEMMGNLREMSLGEILSSRDNRRLMKSIADGECPNCWVESETYRVLAENSLSVLLFGAAGTARNWLRRLAGAGRPPEPGQAD